MKAINKDIQTHWTAISPILSIHNEEEHGLAVGRLNSLIDEIGDNEAHPLYNLLDTIGTLVHAYEEEHHAMPEVSGADMLRFFMEEHGLAQSDLPELGSQGVVSEILNGRRELNIRQVRALAKKFHISPAVFI